MEIERILSDLSNEPAWRIEAGECMDYYDNNQLTGARRAELEERGMEPVVRNVIAPAINALLGMEERNRQDWRVLAEEEGDTDEAVALSRKLHEVERLSGADRSCSDAFSSQAKIGLGWVEVRENDDPFGYPVVAESPRWQEMWWDWRARHPLLDDARYLVRRKWFDADDLAARFPKHKTLIENATSGWPAWHSGLWEQGGVDLGSAYEREMLSSVEESEWRQSERKRLALFEVWYRQVTVGDILEVPQIERVVELEQGNQLHEALVAAGLGRVRKVPLRKMRRAYWVGPHKLSDEPSPYRHPHFPYVPFFGFREDRTLIPYGLIRLQKSPQDEANRRLAKMDWLLNAKTLMADSDAFQGLTWGEVIAESGRPDAALPLNPNRRNAAQVPKLHEHGDMSAQQFSVLQDALRWVSEVGGIYQAMLGKSTEQQSGVAINSLVEQGSTTQGELFGNYRLSRTRVGDLLLAQTKRMLEGREVAVSIQRGSERRQVVFNRRLEGGGVSNAMTALKTRVELSDVPSTPTFRAQMLNQLTDLTKSLPPEVQGILIPTIVRGTDLPQKDEVAQLLEQAMGRGGKEPQDAEQAVAAEAQAVTGQQQAAFAEHAMAAEQQAKVRLEEAKASKAESEAERARLEAQRLAQEMQAQAFGQNSEAALLAEAMQRRQMRLTQPAV